MLETDTIVEDNDIDVALEGEELNEEAPDYSALEQDKLIEELQKRDGEIAKSKKSYDEFRSMTDRKATETGERLAKLEGRLEATAVKPVEQEVDYSSLEKEMEEEFEDDPKKAAKYFVQMTKEFNAALAENRQTIESNVQSSISRTSATYKANKALVDTCVERGMTLPDALEFVSELKSNEVAQPGTPKAPGVVEAGRAVNTRPAPPKVDVSAFDMKVFKATGMTDEEIDKIAKDMARDMVNA